MKEMLDVLFLNRLKDRYQLDNEHLLGQDVNYDGRKLKELNLHVHGSLLK